MNDTKNKEIFENMPVPRALKEMALPTIFSQIIVLIYNMADTFYIGRTNDPYKVAGVSLLLPVFNISLSLSGLAGIGGGSQISRLLGEKREDEAKKTAAFSFWLAIIATAVFSLIMLIFMRPLLNILGASDNTFQYAQQYTFCVIVLGGVPTVLSSTMSNLLRSVGYSKQAGFGITMGGIVNMILDPIFMFVLLPKGYEVLGVGIATLLSNCLACIYFLVTIYRLKGSTVLGFSLKNGLPSAKNILAIFNVGIPSAVATFLFDMDYVVIDRLMSGYGDIALAAIGIVLKAERLPLNVGIGICQGMLPLVAYNYSAKNHKRMDDIIAYSIKVGIVVSIISIALYEAFSPLILRIFISEPQTVLLGTNFLRARCLATPLMFASFFTVYVFQGFGRGERSLFLGIMRWAVFNIPMLFVLEHIFGMYGIVWSQVTADILTVALSVWVYKQFRKSTEKNT